MFESTPPSPMGSLILLGILMFIVYRILHFLSGQHTEPRSGSGGDKVFRLPQKSRPAPPPAVAKLEPVTGAKDPFAHREEAISAHKALIEKGGLNRIGDFSIQGMPGYFIRAFTHPDFFLLGVIYLDPNDRVWVNLITEYTDGRVITSTSAEAGVISQSRPHGMPLFTFPGLDTEQLLRRHKLETRGVERKGPMAPEDYPEYFSKNYAKLRAHIYQREQEEAEHRTGPGPVIPFPTPPVPDAPAGERREEEAAEDFVPTAAQQRKWLKAIFNTVNVPKEKRDRFLEGLVWVQERADAESIMDTFSDYADVTVERVEQGRLVIRTESGAEDIIEPGDLKGPALFDKINSCLPDAKKFTRLPVSMDGVAFYNRRMSGVV